MEHPYCKLTRFLEFLKIFRKSGPVEVQSSDMKLLSVLEKGDVLQMVSLLESGADVNAVTKQNMTPLHMAVRHNHLDCVTRLLHHPEIDVHKMERLGRTPFILATIWKRHDIMKLLLDHDPTVINAADLDGKTALHVASSNGDLSVVRFLIDNKANVNALDQRRHSPLTCAVKVGHIETVKFLLEHQADCNQNQRQSICTSPLRMAIERHDLDLVKLLLDYGSLVEFTQTITLGSFSSGHRQTNICHNLSAFALDCVDLTHPQSVKIAEMVIQASPAAPEEENCLKLYEQYIKPNKRYRRSMSRELTQLIETISPSTLDSLLHLLRLSFAVGMDLSTSNVERLKRKFRLDPVQDVMFFDLIREANQQSLELLAIRAVRKRLTDAGNDNIVVALKRSNFPQFVRELILLKFW